MFECAFDSAYAIVRHARYTRCCYARCRGECAARAARMEARRDMRAMPRYYADFSIFAMLAVLLCFAAELCRMPPLPLITPMLDTLFRFHMIFAAPRHCRHTAATMPLLTFRYYLMLPLPPVSMMLLIATISLRRHAAAIRCCCWLCHAALRCR